MICPNKECHINETFGNFCIKCGARLVSQNQCPDCKAEVFVDQTFCRNCGVILRVDANEETE